MSRKSPLLLAALLLFPGAAGANLVTFEFWGSALRGNRFGCLLSEFEADTGRIAAEGPHPYTGTFTVDTTAIAEVRQPDGAGYYVDQPGTGLSLTLGTLTLFWSDFWLVLWEENFTCGDGSDWIIIDSGDVLLPFSTCNTGITEVFTDFTLSELATVSLTPSEAMGTASSVILVEAGPWTRAIDPLASSVFLHLKTVVLLGFGLAGLLILCRSYDQIWCMS